MGLFTREDDLRALGFAEADGVLYCLGEDGSILSFGERGTASHEGQVSWMAQSGLLGLSLGEKKYIAGVQARLRPALGSKVHFHIAYDSDPHFSHVGSIIGKNETNTVTFTLHPRRCDHFRLKISGKGDAELISITLKIRKGEQL